jgi:hypothetical protein
MILGFYVSIAGRSLVARLFDSSVAGGSASCRRDGFEPVTPA